MVELTSRLIEAQEDINMKRLSLNSLSSKSKTEPTEVDNALFNALLNSTITHLTEVNFENNINWFKHSEMRSHILSFI